MVAYLSEDARLGFLSHNLPLQLQGRIIEATTRRFRLPHDAAFSAAPICELGDTIYVINKVDLVLSFHCSLKQL